MGKKEADQNMELIYGEKPPGLGQMAIAIFKFFLRLPLTIANVLTLNYLNRLTNDKLNFPYDGDKRRGK